MLKMPFFWKGPNSLTLDKASDNVFLRYIGQTKNRFVVLKNFFEV